MPRKRSDTWPDDVRVEVQAVALRITREAERAAELNLKGNREGVQKCLVKIAVLAWDIKRMAEERA